MEDDLRNVYSGAQVVDCKLEVTRGLMLGALKWFEKNLRRKLDERDGYQKPHLMLILGWLMVARKRGARTPFAQEAVWWLDCISYLFAHDDSTFAREQLLVSEIETVGTGVVHWVDATARVAGFG